MNERYVDSRDGTGASIDIYCGFVPDHVQVVNVESATIEQLDWYTGMTNGHAIKTVTGTVARTKITTLGITMLDSETYGLGFRIGADTDVNVSGEALAIIATRGGAGNQKP